MSKAEAKNKHPALKIYFQMIFEFTWYATSALTVKAHCCDVDYADRTTIKNRKGHATVIFAVTEIHEGDNDLTPFFLETT